MTLSKQFEPKFLIYEDQRKGESAMHYLTFSLTYSPLQKCFGFFSDLKLC